MKSVWQSFLHRLTNDIHQYATSVLASTMQMNCEALWAEDEPVWEAIFWHHMVQSVEGTAQATIGISSASVDAIVGTTAWPVELPMLCREQCAVFMCLNSPIFGRLPAWLADTATPNRVISLTSWLMLPQEERSRPSLPIVISRLPLPWKLGWLAAFLPASISEVLADALAGNPLTASLPHVDLDLLAFVLKQPSGRPIAACGATASEALSWARQAAYMQPSVNPIVALLTRGTSESVESSLKVAMGQGTWLLLQLGPDAPVTLVLPLLRTIRKSTRLTSPAFRLWICCAHDQQLPSELDRFGVSISVGVATSIASYWFTMVSDICRHELEAPLRDHVKAIPMSMLNGSSPLCSPTSTLANAVSSDTQQDLDTKLQALYTIAGVVAFECECSLLQPESAWWINIDRLSELANHVRQLISQAASAQLLPMLSDTIVSFRQNEDNLDDLLERIWQQTVVQALTTHTLRLSGVCYDILDEFVPM
jgi:hypothetical protein